MKKLIVIILIIACLGLSLAGCAKKITNEDGYTLFKKGFDNSMNAEIYYIKETIMNGKEVSSNTFNVLCSTDKNGIPLRNADNTYKNLKMKIVKTTKNEKKVYDTLIEINAGESISADSSNKIKQETVFYSELNADYNSAIGNSEKHNKTKKQMSTTAYYNSEEHMQNYSLQHLISELAYLERDDMDFDYKKSVCEKQGIVTRLKFKLKESFYSRVLEKTGKESKLKSDQIYIETINEQISNVFLYNISTLAGGKIELDEEIYKLEVVYLGPKFDLPKYDEKKDSKDEKGQIIVDGNKKPIKIPVWEERVI